MPPVAVKTELQRGEVEEIARELGLGVLRAFAGIAKGSINTLYEMECASGRFVLRLSEGRSDEEVSFELALLEFLAEAAFPAARPVRAQFARVAGRQASVFHWAPGEELGRGEALPAHCMEVGRLLGRLHLLGEAFPRRLPNRYRPEVIAGWVEKLERSGVGEEELRAALPLLRREAEAALAMPALPVGVVHADLFMDNVKWLGDRAAAVLDWEMACTDAFALDLAIAVHAWCFDERFEPSLVRALLDGYRAQRKLSPEEGAGFMARLRFAAVRYTVTRIRDFHLSPLAPERLVKKDWRRYLRRLQALGEIRPVVDAALGAG